MKKMICFLIGFVFVLASCSTVDPDVTDPVQEDTSTLYKHIYTTDKYMNTVTYITYYHTVSFDEDKLDLELEALLEREHGTFNAQTDESELGLVNLHAFEKPVVVSDELYLVIDQALSYAALSDGGYDPTIGPLADLWGISGDSWFAGGEVPTEELIQEALSFVDYTQVKLDKETQTVSYLKEGIKLDLGGIAKGYISELLWNYLKDQGIEHAIINVGSSSQLTIGTRCTEKEVTQTETTYQATNDPWKIGTSDPYDMFGFQAPVGIFTLMDKGLSSSGSAQQFFEVDGVRYHHIFDTTTGYPVNNDIIVVQIVTDDLMGIDALSTMIYIMGIEDGMAFVEAKDGLEAIFITYDKHIYKSSGFGDYEINNKEYKFA